ncbi:hypothetical protein [Paenibacillus naphthalenovorans]|uniref:hypothetical protein n=1 Tax=Paenibacillus naphthalenovorans TaxID=162209 RepID=UPI003D2C2118
MNSDKSKMNNISLLGSGARRIVYDLGNGYVLKVAKSKYGIKSNKREVNTYRSSPPPLRKRLAEIIDYGNHYRWLIMKKHTRKFPNSSKHKRNLYKLRIMFKSNGIRAYEVLTRRGKPNYENLRVNRNGKIVVIDYGNFKFHR